MAYYYLALVIFGSLLWWTNNTMVKSNQELIHYRRILGGGILLAGCFPLIMSFLPPAAVITLLLLLTVFISWHLPAPVPAATTKEINQDPLVENSTTALVTAATAPTRDSNVHPSIVSSLYMGEQVSSIQSHISPSSAVDQDALILAGFNYYSSGNLNQAAKAFTSVWKASKEPELLLLVYSQLMNIYRELGQYKKAILLGHMTKSKLPSSMSQHLTQIDSDLIYLRRLYIFLAASGLGHLPYSAVPPNYKQLALNKNNLNLE